MANDVTDHAARIIERLRRDHPDPAMREELYASGGLPEYVRVLMNGVDNADELVDQIATAVREAEDGQPGPSAPGE